MDAKMTKMLVLGGLARELAGQILSFLDYAGDDEDVALDTLLFHLDTWERPALLDAIQAKLNDRG